MDIALKLLRKEGGVVIYYSQDMKNIDGLLQEINARKLETKGDVMTKTRVTSTLKSYIREYQTIGFILKDLNLSSIKLVTHDTNIVEVAQQLGIDIIKLAPTITFDYGEQEG
jgi:GTP cyclohydrolase II